MTTKPRKTKAEKAADARANRLCSQRLSALRAQISIFDLSKVHLVAYAALMAGRTEEGVISEIDEWIGANRTDGRAGKGSPCDARGFLKADDDGLVTP